VFHDDQHGTAIVTAAGILNALEVTNRDIKTVRIACNGAGAAALACLDLLVSFGASKDNILVCDRKGVIHADRTDLDQYKGAYAAKTEARSLADAINGADIFLGLSAKDSVTQDMVKTMAARPIIFAMANPDPEIRPELVHEVRSDAIVATGRSDYPNQVNNVLCFPFIFRGALDCGATEINEAMKRACAEAIARLARIEASDVVLAAYGADSLHFGPEYIIPKPFGPGGDGLWRCHPADRGHGRLSRAAPGLRLPLGPADEAGLRPGRPRPEARGLRRRRDRAGASRSISGGRPQDRPPDPDRQRRDDRRAREGTAPQHRAGR
jgi:malate dehydrogenase (oxaloacetate-decarboxylating)(NADP+)